MNLERKEKCSQNKSVYVPNVQNVIYSPEENVSHSNLCSVVRTRGSILNNLCSVRNLHEYKRTRSCARMECAAIKRIIHCIHEDRTFTIANFLRTKPLAVCTRAIGMTNERNKNPRHNKLASQIYIYICVCIRKLSSHQVLQSCTI